MRFEGSKDYVTTPDLMLAVNAAIRLQRPLLIKGEPGTWKTMLAQKVAMALGLPLLQWHVKSTTKAQIPLESLRSGDVKEAMPPLAGALLKIEQYMHLYERLVAMARQNR